MNLKFFLILFFICSFLYAQETADSQETLQRNTLKYGTETEIVNLIQTLKTESLDYLDNELIVLADTSRNQKILTGIFAFFSEREKKGLEKRAVRAIEDQENEKNDTIIAAIDYLGRVKAAEDLPVLKNVIENGDRRFLNSALRAYGRAGGGSGSESTEYLIGYYENGNPEGENQREIITALGAIASVSAVDFLAGIAADNDERVPLRMAALESIAKIGDTSAEGRAGLDAVVACVTAADPNVRSAAVGALGPFSGASVDEAILDAFRDSFFRTRIAAAQASRQRKLAAAVPYLKFRAERDEVPSVREESVRALGAIANSESIAILDELFTERKNNERVRISSGEMLMQINPAKYLDNVIKELDEAKQKNQTALYNGLLKIIGTAKCANMEAITRRLMESSGVVEKSYALDMAANNNLSSLAAEIKAVAEGKSESLAAKARRTLEKLGIK